MLKLYEYLQQEEGDSSTSKLFLASKGWSDKFTKCQKLQDIRLIGEATSSDCCCFYIPRQVFKIAMVSVGYKPQQVFNANKTGIF